MAVRIRKNGRIMCAAMHPEEPGDTYIDDTLHHEMSTEHKVLVTEEHEQHQFRGEWWWAGNIPDGIKIANFYTDNNTCKFCELLERLYNPTNKTNKDYYVMTELFNLFHGGDVCDAARRDCASNKID